MPLSASLPRIWAGHAIVGCMVAGAAGIRERLADIISAVRAVFGDRVIACYLCGSNADGSACTGSDLDLFVVFAGTAADEERERLAGVTQAVAASSPVRLDAAAISQQFLQRAARPACAQRFC